MSRKQPKLKKHPLQVNRRFLILSERVRNCLISSLCLQRVSVPVQSTYQQAWRIRLEALQNLRSLNTRHRPNPRELSMNLTCLLSYRTRHSFFISALGFGMVSCLMMSKGSPAVLNILLRFLANNVLNPFLQNVIGFKTVSI